MKISQKISFIFFFFITTVFAQSSENIGTASNVFLRTGISARTAALGESFTGIANDENALFYNPAGLTNIKESVVGLNHTQWFEDIKIDNLTFGYTYERNWGFALGISHLWMPELKGLDFDGNPTGDNISVSSSIINLGVGYQIHPTFSIGIGIKYFNDKLADFSANGFAFDAGFHMRTLVRGLTFGAAIQNIGGKVSYDVEKEKLPMLIRTGVAYSIPNTDVLISVDGIKAADTGWLFATGIEYTLLKQFAIRLGNQFKDEQVFSPGFGLGFGFDDQYIFDYTFSPVEDLGSTHRIGFTFNFNLPGNKARIRTPYKSYLSKSRKESQSPTELKADVRQDKVIISWNAILNAGYNVYAKLTPESSWKKINNNLVQNAIYEFKKPSGIDRLMFTVTAVIDDREGPFSKELIVDVK